MFPGVEIKNEQALKLLEPMDFQQGQIKLGAGGVKLDIPAKYYFLGTADAQRTLVDIWDCPGGCLWPRSLGPKSSIVLGASASKASLITQTLRRR